MHSGAWEGLTEWQDVHYSTPYRRQMAVPEGTGWSLGTVDLWRNAAS